MKQHLVALMLATFVAAGIAQTSTDRAAAVDQLFELNAREGPEAVDRQLNVLPRSVREQLEADVWKRLLDTGRVTRQQFAREMIGHTQRWRPEDIISLDFWRYQLLLSQKLDAREITEAEAEYLGGRSLDRLNAAEEAERKAHIDANARSQALRAQVQAEADVRAKGAALQSIGAALRDYYRRPVETNCAPLLNGGVSCLSR